MKGMFWQFVLVILIGIAIFYGFAVVVNYVVAILVILLLVFFRLMSVSQRRKRKFYGSYNKLASVAEFSPLFPIDELFSLKEGWFFGIGYMQRCGFRMIWTVIDEGIVLFFTITSRKGSLLIHWENIPQLIIYHGDHQLMEMVVDGLDCCLMLPYKKGFEFDVPDRISVLQKSESELVDRMESLER